MLFSPMNEGFVRMAVELVFNDDFAASLEGGALSHAVMTRVAHLAHAGSE